METEDKTKKDQNDSECIMDEKEMKDRTDLCCCYVVDPCGCYSDPCFHPVSSCCC